MHKTNLIILFVFIAILSAVSVDAIITVQIGNISNFDINDGRLVPGAQQEAEGCNDQPAICHNEKFKTTTQGKDFEARGNIDCTCDSSVDDKCENDCEEKDGGCLCFYEKSKGKCKENIACEGIATTKKDKSPCGCGDVFTSTDKPYCFEDANFVGTETQCNLIDSCSDCSSLVGSCIGLPCGAGGVCSTKSFCYVPGVNLCEEIPRARCINLNSEVYMTSECRKQIEDNNLTDATCSELKLDKKLNGFIPHPGGRKANGIRFPSSLELQGINWESSKVKGTLLYDLKGNADYMTFQDKYVPTRDAYEGHGSQFRRELCGVNADIEGETAVWRTVCAVRETTSCNDINLVDSLFGGTNLDPAQSYIWDKIGIAEGYSKWSSELTKDWNVASLGGDWEEAADLTSLICKLKLRKEYTEDSTSKVETRKETPDLVLMINGQKSPLLPNNETLYEISWMIFNKKGSGRDINYSVYAYDEDEEKFHYALKDGVKVHGIELAEGSTGSGYYAFYFNNSVDFEYPRIKHSVDTNDVYSPQEFVPETYGGTYEPSETSASGEDGGGSSVDAGDSSNEV